MNTISPEELQTMLEEILNIKPNNKFLSYIVERVQRDEYRGIQISQHNRYDMEGVIAILKSVYEVVQDDFLPIPLGDLTTDAVQDDIRRNHQPFVDVVVRIKSKMKRTTPNSLKKNFFVDFARAGFIDRFDKDKSRLDPNNRSHVYFARLTEDAIRLIQAESLTDRYYIFSRKVDALFGDAISDLAEMIYNSDYASSLISYTEFQYILSDTQKLPDEKINLLNSYRKLDNTQKLKLHRLLKKYCTPDNFDGSKTIKRDYDNWRNETQQIMYLLKNTIYFDVRESTFALNTGGFGIFPDTEKLARRGGVKQKYFSEHEVSKRADFDLHHIVPIKLVKNKAEFILIDDYRNLIYIARIKHTAVKDHHIVLAIKDGVVKFIDINSESEYIEVENGVTALYKRALVPQMLSYNQRILQEVLNAN